MRIFRIFLVHSQTVLEQRGRSLVWFINAALPCMIFLMFWAGALQTQGGTISGWNFSSISSYYFLLTIAGSFLIVHIEEDVAEKDIQQGNLVQYLIRPFSYFWLKFFEELPYRLLQGFYGIILCFIFFLFVGKFFSLSRDFTVILLSIVIVFNAYMLSFIYKMIIGLSAFWLVDARGFFQLVEAILIIFGGFILPLTLLPTAFAQIALTLPFAYMLYFPVVAIQGQLSYPELFRVIGIQVVWLVTLSLLYNVTWSFGRKKFTGIGQ